MVLTVETMFGHIRPICRKGAAATFVAATLTIHIGSVQAGEIGSMSPPAHRSVVLLSFDHAPSQEPKALTGGKVGSSLEANFRMIVPNRTSPAMVRIPRPIEWAEASASPRVPLELPKWGEVQFSTALCSSKVWTDSGLLSLRGEANRRVLYSYVRDAACAANVPVELLDAVIIQESRYNPGAVSPKGAIGLGQLMPATAAHLRVNSSDILQNLAGAARYLRSQIDAFGSPLLALAAYNAGPNKVRRAGGVPNIRETREYARSVINNWVRLQSM